MLGAIALREARRASPGRAPISLDLTFIRGVPEGDAVAVADVIAAGRSMSSVAVTIAASDRVSTTALVKLVDQAVLADVALDGAAASQPPAPPYASGREWGDAGAIPMIGSLRPRTITGDDRGVGFALEVPWTGGDAHAEAACFAADGCVGAPVAIEARGAFAHPNPDIAMRFMPGATAGREVVGFGRVERGGGGAVLVGVQVWSGASLLAVGVSCSLQLPTGQ